MKKITFLSVLILVGFLLSSIIFTGCKDDSEYDSLGIGSESSKIMKLKSDENIDELISKLVSMQTSELRKYEDSKGYKSFGRVAEEFYESIDFDNIKDIEELKRIVDESPYLIFVESDGDTFIETPLYNNPLRYLVNSDHIYQYGDMVYKVFQEGSISTKQGNVSQLKMITKFTSNTKGSNGIFNYHPKYGDFDNEEFTKDAANVCPNSREASQKSRDNKNMNKITVELTTATQHYNSIYTIARPYKRTLYVYYWCSRTMRAHFKARLDEYVNYLGGWYTTAGGRNNYDYYDSKIESYVSSSHTQQQNVSNVHIGSNNSWMESQDASAARILCNEWVVGSW